MALLQPATQDRKVHPIYVDCRGLHPPVRAYFRLLVRYDHDYAPRVPREQRYDTHITLTRDTRDTYTYTSVRNPETGINIKSRIAYTRPGRGEKRGGCGAQCGYSFTIGGGAARLAETRPLTEERVVRPPPCVTDPTWLSHRWTPLDLRKRVLYLEYRTSPSQACALNAEKAREARVTEKEHV